MEDVKRRIAEWHDEYWSVLADFARQHGLEEPRAPVAELNLRVAKRAHAGTYYEHGNRCVYVLPFAVVGGDSFRQTVAHECCHSMARQLDPHSRWHGELFMFLLRRVCAFQKATRFHTFNVPQAREVGEALEIALRGRRHVLKLPRPTSRQVAQDAPRSLRTEDR